MLPPISTTVTKMFKAASPSWRMVLESRTLRHRVRSPRQRPSPNCTGRRQGARPRPEGPRHSDRCNRRSRPRSHGAVSLVLSLERLDQQRAAPPRCDHNSAMIMNRLGTSRQSAGSNLRRDASRTRAAPSAVGWRPSEVPWEGIANERTTFSAFVRIRSCVAFVARVGRCGAGCYRRVGCVQTVVSAGTYLADRPSRTCRPGWPRSRPTRSSRSVRRPGSRERQRPGPAASFGSTAPTGCWSISVSRAGMLQSLPACRRAVRTSSTVTLRCAP